mmetsp:Transcript_34304/g.86275  ORF Transcript_34304/g.86275 Transcript_34304/m.86275 type:complete len:270 (+) Transcript_34304:474-1283(+)
MTTKASGDGGDGMSRKADDDVHNERAKYRRKDGETSPPGWWKRDFGVEGMLRDGESNIEGFEWLEVATLTDSFVVHKKQALDVSEADFDSFWNVGLRDVAPTPNPRNRRHFLRRRQATYGSSYTFGAQGSEKIGSDDRKSWPSAVCAAVKDAHTRSSMPPRFRLVAHVNWYPSGEAILAPHYDKIDMFVAGAPIFSYTLIRNSPPRGFQIYSRASQHIIYREFLLGDGDLLVMGGNMQSHYLHGVKASKPASLFKNSRRINITVRFLES